MGAIKGVAGIIAAAAVWTACSSSTGSGSQDGGAAQPTACTPGDQKGCACPGGGSGVQVCADDGTAWGDCTGCGGSAGGGGGTAGTAGTGANAGAGGTGGSAGTGGKGGTAGAAGTGGTGGSGGTAGTGGAGGTGGCPTPLCGGSCCAAGTVCVKDKNGNGFCRQTCTSSSQCGAGQTPCCALLQNNGGACLPSPTAAEPYWCRCTYKSECGEACAPLTDTNSNPVGPYVCKYDDGQPYNGCHGALTTCASGTCCFGDNNGNLFCAAQCANDSQCGAAHCHTYDNSHTICTGNKGCGP